MRHTFTFHPVAALLAVAILAGSGYLALSGGDPIPGTEPISVGTPKREGPMPYLGGSPTLTAGFKDWESCELGGRGKATSELLIQPRQESSLHNSGWYRGKVRLDVWNAAQSPEALAVVTEQLRSLGSLAGASVAHYSSRITSRSAGDTLARVSENTIVVGRSDKAMFFLTRPGVPTDSDVHKFLLSEIALSLTPLSGKYSSLTPPMVSLSRRGWVVQELPTIDSRIDQATHPLSKAVRTLGRLIEGATSAQLVSSEDLFGVIEFVSPFLQATTTSTGALLHISSRFPENGRKLESLHCVSGAFSGSYCAWTLESLKPEWYEVGLLESSAAGALQRITYYDGGYPQPSHLADFVLHSLRPVEREEDLLRHFIFGEGCKIQYLNGTSAYSYNGELILLPQEHYPEALAKAAGRERMIFRGGLLILACILAMILWKVVTRTNGVIRT